MVVKGGAQPPPVPTSVAVQTPSNGSGGSISRAQIALVPALITPIAAAVYGVGEAQRYELRQALENQISMCNESVQALDERLGERMNGLRVFFAEVLGTTREVWSAQLQACRDTNRANLDAALERCGPTRQP